MSNTKLPAPFGYFCEWKAPVGSPPSQTLYYGEPGNGVDDDWSRHPEIHKNLPLFTAEQMHAYAMADRERQAGEAVAWEVRRTDGSPLARWEACTPDLYEETLRTGRYAGYEGGPPCEVRALGVLASLPAPQAVQAGWKLVPVEPTDKMIDATYAGQHCSDIWRDMLAAAPSPDGKAEPAQWIDDPHDIEQGQMLNPEWLKLQASKAEQAEAPSDVVAFEFYNPTTGHAIVDYTVNTHVGRLGKEQGYEARSLGYINPPPAAVKIGDPVPLWQAREALDSLEESARGDAPYSHFAANIIRTALEQAATQPTASNAGEPEPASIKALRDALALQGVPIGNMVDRHTARERFLKAQTAWQAACTPDAIKWLLNRAALASKPPAGEQKPVGGAK